MILFLLTAAGVLAVVVCLVIIIRLLVRRGSIRGTMIYRNGTDAKNGRLGNGGSIFQRAPYPTLVMGGRSRRRPGWHLVLLDRRTGQRYTARLTRSPLILGRGTPGRMAGDVLGIGAAQDISHRQFVIADDRGSLVLTNIGQHTAARINGEPFTGPVRLTPGMVLQAGSACIQIIPLGQVHF